LTSKNRSGISLDTGPDQRRSQPKIWGGQNVWF